MTGTNDVEALESSRLSWQAVAEHVMSAALHRATGRIGLRQSRGGFSTPTFRTDEGERRIAVAGDELVVVEGGHERRAALTTLRAAGELAGIEPGAPASVYTPSTPLDLDAPLTVDRAAASTLASWYALVNEALEALRAERAVEEPTIVQLWPEHFDLACTISEVNYGGSPGDDGHPVPYLYVGPFAPPPVADPFWNEPFGASRDLTRIAVVEDALAFFREGEARLDEETTR
jgi:hypothetical protein